MRERWREGGGGAAAVLRSLAGAELSTHQRYVRYAEVPPISPSSHNVLASQLLGVYLVLAALTWVVHQAPVSCYYSHSSGRWLLRLPTAVHQS